jgi:hypothetical protein
MRLIIAAILSLSGRTYAHSADIIYVLIHSDEHRAGTLTETLTMSPETLLKLAPVDADSDGEVTQKELESKSKAIELGVWNDAPLQSTIPCKRIASLANARPGFIELSAQFECTPGPLTQDFRLLRVLPANYRVMIGSQSSPLESKQWAQGTFTSLAIPRFNGPSAALAHSQPGLTHAMLAIAALTLIASFAWFMKKKSRRPSA